MTEPTATGDTTGDMRTFFALWLGELLSLTGTAMTGFALGVWVYQTTGSATQFAAIVVVLFLPQVFVTMISGVLADRYSRRHLILVANLSAAVISAILLAIVAAGALSTPVVYAATFLISACGSIQYPAFASSVPQLVPEKQLGRANGMVQMANASSRMLAPASAALLMPIVGIGGVVLIDMLTFIAMVATLAVIRIPQPAKAATGAGVRRVLSDVREGWSYIMRSPGLLRLLGYFSLANVAGAFTIALLPPLVLDFATTEDLGWVLSIEGFGWLLGAIAMIAWGGPKPRVHGVLIGGIVFGVGIMMLGLRSALPLIAAGVFVYAVALPIINACNASIWQAKVPADLLGRAFATLRMVALASVPVSAISAGVLADAVFKPMVGEDRGIPLILILCGLLPIVGGIAAYMSRHVLHVEDKEPVSVPAKAAEVQSEP